MKRKDLTIAEMAGLEDVLESKEVITLDDLLDYDQKEVAYLFRARRLPYKAINRELGLFEDKDTDVNQLINVLSEEYKTSARDIFARIGEVKLISEYNRQKADKPKEYIKK